MFREGGLAYVYLIYGIYNLFNIVTHVEGEPLRSARTRGRASRRN